MAPHDGWELDGREPRLARLRVQIQFGTPEVLCGQPGVDPVSDHGAQPDEEARPRRSWRSARVSSSGILNRRQEIHASEFSRLARIYEIGLGARLPHELDLVRMRDDHAVPQLAELQFEPVPVEGAFERDRERLGQRPEPAG